MTSPWRRQPRHRPLSGSVATTFVSAAVASAVQGRDYRGTVNPVRAEDVSLGGCSAQRRACFARQRDRLFHSVGHDTYWGSPRVVGGAWMRGFELLHSLVVPAEHAGEHAIVNTNISLPKSVSGLYETVETFREIRMRSSKLP